MNYRIKDLCKEKGITIGDLSDKVGIARESISRIIGGNNTSTNTLQKIATALNVPISALFHEAHPNNNNNNIITCPHCNGKIKVSKEE